MAVSAVTPGGLEGGSAGSRRRWATGMVVGVHGGADSENFRIMVVIKGQHFDEKSRQGSAGSAMEGWTFMT